MRDRDIEAPWIGENNSDWKEDCERERVVARCEQCDIPLYEGDDYYNVRGVCFCEYCMEDFKRRG